MANTPVSGDSADPAVPAVIGTHTGATGSAVEGHSDTGYALYGHTKSGRGVVATSETTYGLRAHSGTSSAIRASSDSGVGIEGETTTGEAGIRGFSPNAIGVHGRSTSGTGVAGESATGAAISGRGVTGGFFEGTFEGIHVQTAASQAAVAAYNTNASGDGFGIFAKKVGPKGFAGFFDGNVWVSEVLTVNKDVVCSGADCAEDFDVAWDEDIEPGEVLTLGEGGRLSRCRSPYDKRVAGVVSGAGLLRPAILLDRQRETRDRRPIALIGKVSCKVDATHGAVEVGDLLTTSSTPGHAMRAADPMRAFGSVIGKALQPLPAGQGLIVMLVCLQ